MNLENEQRIIEELIRQTPSDSKISKEIAEYYIKEINYIKRVWYAITFFLIIGFLVLLILVSASAIPSKVGWDKEIDHRLPIEYLDTTKYSIK